MIILGLDPGIARTGFGVVDTSRSNYFVRCGVLTTPAGEAVEDRLATIGGDLQKIIATYKPEEALVEQIFFGANRKTAIVTAQTRGVLLYVLRTHGIMVHSLTPLQIKSRLTGQGRATKHQVQMVLMKRLHLTSPPEPDDAADALAAAVCLADSHAHL